MRIWFLLYFMLFMINFIFSQSLNEAQTAANDAARRLEEAFEGKYGLSGYSQNNASIQVTRGGRQPAWVTDPYSAYSRNHYIAAVGFASTRTEAEKKAFAALVSYFGQSIKADMEIAVIYSEAVSNDVVIFSENTRVRDTIVTAASLDTLIGAEIGSIWDDGRGTINVLAYMEKSKTVSIYTDLTIINNSNIELLTSVSTSEKNSFNGYARYKLAALIAGVNADYANIVSLSGGSTASLNLISADKLNLEIQQIIRGISVGFNVSGDNNNRVRDTFAKVLNNKGLRTQGSNTPYVLDIDINMAEAVFPNNAFKFCRFTINANLI